MSDYGADMNSDSTAGHARSTTGASASGRTTADRASMRSDAASRMAANPLDSRSANEVKGTDIIDVIGEKIGDIKEVVLSNDRRSAHAIGVGGFLGMGKRDIDVSLDELKAHDGDELQLSTAKKGLRARPQYQSDQYSEMEGERP